MSIAPSWRLAIPRRWTAAGAAIEPNGSEGAAPEGAAAATGVGETAVWAARAKPSSASTVWPILIVSPPERRTAPWTFCPFTNVPLREPRSSISNPPAAGRPPAVGEPDDQQAGAFGRGEDAAVAQVDERRLGRHSGELLHDERGGLEHAARIALTVAARRAQQLEGRAGRGRDPGGELERGPV